MESGWTAARPRGRRNENTLTRCVAAHRLRLVTHADGQRRRGLCAAGGRGRPVLLWPRRCGDAEPAAYLRVLRPQRAHHHGGGRPPGRPCPRATARERLGASRPVSLERGTPGRPEAERLAVRVVPVMNHQAYVDEPNSYASARAAVVIGLLSLTLSGCAFVATRQYRPMAGQSDKQLAEDHSVRRAEPI